MSSGICWPKAQISLRIPAVWSGPSLSTNNIVGYYRMENKGLDEIAHGQDNLKLRRFEDTFLLDVIHFIFYIETGEQFSCQHLNIKAVSK